MFLGLFLGRVAARGLYRRRVAETLSLWNFCGIFHKFSKLNFSGFRRPNRLKFSTSAPLGALVLLVASDVPCRVSRGSVLPEQLVQLRNTSGSVRCAKVENYNGFC